MHRRISWHFYLCAAMIAGILICAALLITTLLSPTPKPSPRADGAYFVWEESLYEAL